MSLDAGKALDACKDSMQALGEAATKNKDRELLASMAAAILGRQLAVMDFDDVIGVTKFTDAQAVPAAALASASVIMARAILKELDK